MASNKTVEFSGKKIKLFFLEAQNTLIRCPLTSIPALIQPNITLFFVYLNLEFCLFGFNVGFLVWVFYLLISVFVILEFFLGGFQNNLDVYVLIGKMEIENWKNQESVVKC